MPMRPGVCMAVHALAVPMQCRDVRLAHGLERYRCVVHSPGRSRGRNRASLLRTLSRHSAGSYEPPVLLSAWTEEDALLQEHRCDFDNAWTRRDLNLLGHGSRCRGSYEPGVVVDNGARSNPMPP